VKFKETEMFVCPTECMRCERQRGAVSDLVGDDVGKAVGFRVGAAEPTLGAGVGSPGRYVGESVGTGVGTPGR